MKSKIFILMFCMIFLVGTVSAWDFDNKKLFDESVGEYGKIEIFNSKFLGLGQGEKLAEYVLTENTFTCGKECYARGYTNFNNPTILFDELNFYDIYSGEKKSINFQIYIITNHSELINEYSSNCNLLANGTNDCFKTISNQIEIERETLIPYKGELLEGYNEWIIKGQKEEGEAVDWIGKILGIVMNEWADWDGTKKLKFNDTLTSDIGWSPATDIFNETGLFMIQNCTSNFCSETKDTGISNKNITEFRIKDFHIGTGSYSSSRLYGAISFGPDTNNMNLAGTDAGCTPQTQGISGQHNNNWAYTILQIDSSNVSLWYDFGSFDNIDTGGPPNITTTCTTINYTNTTLALGWDKRFDNIIYKDLTIYKRNESIALINPINNFNTLNTSLTFEANISNVDPLSLENGELINATVYVYYPDGSIFNTNTTSITGLQNFSSLTLSNLGINDSYQWNYLACVENVTASNCDFAESNFTLNIRPFIENSQTFNSTTYETSQESFIINLSSGNSNTVSAKLFYNGTDQGTGTKFGDDSEMRFEKSIQIKTISSSTIKEFYWEITVGNSILNSTFNNQTVNPTTFILCNSTINVPYINYTFKNETTSQEDTSAIFSITTSYWLGDGTVNKTLTFSNSTTNPSYSFCLEPSHPILNTVNDLIYNNQESQQRAFSSTAALFNVTTNQILYLLPTSLGLFAQFQTVDFIANSIPLVKGTITRTLDSSIITVASGFTDSSGFINFFLNPDVTYTGTFTKSGFEDNVFVFVPITDIRTIRMASVGGEVNGSKISINTTYQTFPINGSLLNNTDHTFGFNVTGNEDITLISMNISNSSGSQLLFLSNGGTGFISSVLNTGNNTQLIGIFVVQTDDETITFTRLWQVGNIFIGEYSIFKQFTLFTQYGFRDFIKFLIVLSVIIGILIFMSAGEVVETSESKVIVIVLLIWVFSLVGWLDNPAVVSNTGIAEFARQYGLAMLSTAGGILFIFRRIFT